MPTTTNREINHWHRLNIAIIHCSDSRHVRLYDPLGPFINNSRTMAYDGLHVVDLPAIDPTPFIGLPLRILHGHHHHHHHHHLFAQRRYNKTSEDNSTASRTTRRDNTHLQNAPKYTITQVRFTKCLYNIYCIKKNR